MTCTLLAGGGTAGHVNPLLAVADRIVSRDPAASVLVLGTAEGLEARLVPQRGHELRTIPRVPFPRRPDLRAIRFPARFARAVGRTRELIREHDVDLVIGFGGYVASPAYVAAKRERVPYVVHEANARPGLANVWGARDAAAVGIAFAGTPLRGAELVGMPLRAEIASLDRAGARVDAARHFGLDPARPVLLVFGGSTGARRINDAFADAWPAIVAEGWQILHVTGESKIDEVDAAGRTGAARDRVVVPYADRMDLAYALADLVVCRSGAATVSEITALGIPAVYVPYAVGNGEQARNTRSAVDAGAALRIDDAELTGNAVVERIAPLLRDAALRERMARAAESIGTRDGTDRLLELADRSRFSARPGDGTRG